MLVQKMYLIFKLMSVFLENVKRGLFGFDYWFHSYHIYISSIRA